MNLPGPWNVRVVVPVARLPLSVRRLGELLVQVWLAERETGEARVIAQRH